MFGEITLPDEFDDQNVRNIILNTEITHEERKKQFNKLM